MSNREPYYTPDNVGKRRGTPEENSVSFQGQGQGGRIVLPPITMLSSSPFPVPSSYDTQYAQPRSSSRVMLNSYYAQWPDGSNSLSSNESMFVPNYEPQDRYGVQSSYPTYIPPRAPSLFQDLTDSRRLPSLSTTSAAGGDRWQQNLSPNSAPAGIRSPTLSYPTYASYPSGGGAYTYLPTNNLVMNTGVLDLNEPQVRPSSPGLYRTPVVDSSSTPPAPPISPTTTTERPTIKVKRRRANEDQRKKLLETWERTSFPTTEERNELSILTGLKPRQVQVWFQNQRQQSRSSKRPCSNAHSNSTNTHRHCSNAHRNSTTAHTYSAHTQSTTTPSHCHTPYSVTPPATTHCPPRRHGPISPSTEPMYTTPSLDQARSHQSSSPHHQLPSQDDSMEPLKWPSQGF